jgi:lactoylglutathione lyase
MRFGYTIIYVADVPDTIAFYEKAFGIQRRFVVEDGSYGEMDTNGATLAFVDQGFVRTGFGFDFVTEDVESDYHTALAAGAKALVAPLRKPWGQTVAYVRDMNGVIVELCTPMTPA